MNVERDGPVVLPVQPATAAHGRSFERVYETDYRAVHRYALGLTRSRDEADEIVAETFERAFRAWDHVGEPALPWLLLTARRITTDRWRRTARFLRIAAGWRRDARSDGSQAGSEFWLWFDAVAEVLTARQREALLLRYGHDLSDAEIGRVMGVSESGVRSLVARAVAALRSHPELL